MSLLDCYRLHDQRVFSVISLLLAKQSSNPQQTLHSDIFILSVVMYIGWIEIQGKLSAQSFLIQSLTQSAH
jgi:hypothetical protein